MSLTKLTQSLVNAIKVTANYVLGTKSALLSPHAPHTPFLHFSVTVTPFKTAPLSVISTQHRFPAVGSESPSFANYLTLVSLTGVKMYFLKCPYTCSNYNPPIFLLPL